MDAVKSYLETGQSIVSSVQIGDRIPISRVGNTAIRVDEESYDILENQFGLYGDEQRLPTDIRSYFTERRASTRGGMNRWLEEEGLETDEEGNPYFSDLLERRKGNCAEIALVGQIWAEEMMDGINSYFVNGAKLNENLQVGYHAFLIFEQPEEQEYTLVDPSKIFSHGDGHVPLISPIQSIDERGVIDVEASGLGYDYKF